MDWLHWTLIGTTLWFWWKSFQWQREEGLRVIELEALRERLSDAV